MDINQNKFKHKYFKYKNKYLHLKNMNFNGKQLGGEVLSIIKKKNLQSVFYLDFELASQAEFINSDYKYDDNTAIELIKNYDIFLNDLEKMQNDDSGDDSSSEDNIINNDEIYYEEEYINIIRQIDIETWKISNIKKAQYYLVKIQNEDDTYLLKIISSDYKYEFIKNMNEYDTEYGKLKNMKNLLAPQYLFKDDDLILGYILIFNENLVSLDDYLENSENQIDETVFLKIVNGICECYINILRCGMKPCVKNNNVMIINSDNKINIFLTGMDGLINCYYDIEEETVRDITKLINVDKLSREVKSSYCFKRIFNLTDGGLSLKKSIVSVGGLIELIKKIINNDIYVN